MRNYIVSRITDQSFLKGRRFPCNINSESNMIAINVGNGAALLIKPDDTDYIYVLGDDNVSIKTLIKTLPLDMSCKIKSNRTQEKIYTGTIANAFKLDNSILEYRIKKTSISTTPKGKKSIEIKADPLIISDELIMGDFIDMVNKSTIIRIRYNNGNIYFTGPISKITEQSEAYAYSILNINFSENENIDFEVIVPVPDFN